MEIPCSGPGPHIPPSGILTDPQVPTGELWFDGTNITGYICPAAPCVAANVARNQAIAATAVLEANAATAVQATLAANTAFLAITSPTSADVTAQVRTLTTSQSALIYLLLKRLAP